MSGSEATQHYWREGGMRQAPPLIVLEKRSVKDQASVEA
jgi:hypothetical protein